MYTNRQVTPERTHWRDTTLNDLHRCWGWDVPALDIDFIEYYHGEPVALVEYKHEFAAPIYLNALNSNLSVLTKTGTRASLPVFVVRYSDDKTVWKVAGTNSFATSILPQPTEFNLRGFVELLYKIRGCELDDDNWNQITQDMEKIWNGRK